MNLFVREGFLWINSFLIKLLFVIISIQSQTNTVMCVRSYIACRLNDKGNRDCLLKDICMSVYRQIDIAIYTPCLLSFINIIELFVSQLSRNPQNICCKVLLYERKYLRLNNPAVNFLWQLSTYEYHCSNSLQYQFNKYTEKCSGFLKL